MNTNFLMVVLMGFVILSFVGVIVIYADSETDIDKWLNWSSENLNNFDDVIEFLDIVKFVINSGIVQVEINDRYDIGFQDGIKSVDVVIDRYDIGFQDGIKLVDTNDIDLEPIEIKLDDIIIQISINSSFQTCELNDDCYNPSYSKVKVGNKVTWINLDDVRHSVTSGTKGKYVLESNGLFDSGFLLQGQSYERYFRSVGIFDYFCDIHPWQIGTLEVYN